MKRVRQHRMYSHYIQLDGDYHMKNNITSDDFKWGPAGLCFMCTYIHILVFETSGAWTAYTSGSHEFTPSFSGVYIVRSFVVCVVLCRSMFLLLSFFFGHCIACPSSFVVYVVFCRSLFLLLSFFGHCLACPSNYDFWLPLCYLPTVLGMFTGGIHNSRFYIG